MSVIPATGQKPRQGRDAPNPRVATDPYGPPNQQYQSPGLLDGTAPPVDPGQTAPTGPTIQDTVTGVVQQGQDALANPVDFSGLAPIRDQEIIQPGAQQVDVPSPTQFSGPTQASAPIGPSGPAQASAPQQINYNEQGAQQFRGPSELGYQGQRVGQGEQFRFDPNSGTQHSFDPNSGQYFNAPNRNFAQQGSELEQATFRRGMNNIDPYLQEQRQAMAQRLQNQGIPVGSEAYEGELNRFDRSRGNTLENLALSSVGAGRQEQGRLFGQDLASGQFNSSEARRRFAERMGATQFNASEDQRNFGQRLVGTQFNAGESGRGFRERLAGEGQYFNQRMAGDQFAAQQGGAQNAFDAQQQRDLFGRAMQTGQFGAQQSQFGDQFAANQGQFRDQFGAQQQQFGDQFGAQQGQFRDQFNAGQQQQGFQNRFANQGLQQQNDQFTCPAAGHSSSTRIIARRNQGINETMTQRQQPLNELGQILNLGTQAGNFAPQQPQFQPQAAVRADSGELQPI